ncbi:MAG: hypothetical protein WB764_27550 [Xanthobacteraceae bacterium]
MQQVDPLLQANIQIDQRNLRLEIGCNIDEELGIFLLPITITGDGVGNNIVATGELKIAVVNPLALSAVILYAAGTFSICMISKLIDPVTKLFENSYEESKAVEPNRPLRGRIRDLYERVRKNLPTLLEPAEAALRPCAEQAGYKVVKLILGGG